ncbi:MAG: type II toxin-antitoxin system RelE/ParE family toxin [Gammaproteobacteria bacterium]|nr:type II toxin-antitoxin system RelE/ParE family toxin [Gammaproteobacteria bacterium]
MNSIEWTIRAARQLLKLEKAIQLRIRDGVEGLRTFPATANIKRLMGHKYPYRLRVANYRVFFAFDGVIQVVTIEEIRKRDDHTY